MNNYIKTTIIHLLSFVPILCKAQSWSSQKKGSATITVQLVDALPTDTIFLMYFHDPLFNGLSQNGDYERVSPTKTNSNYFQFKMPIDENTGYFFLTKKITGNYQYDHLTYLLKAGAGDNVFIKINKTESKINHLTKRYNYHVSGKGYLKYDLKFRLDTFLFNNTKFNRGAIINKSFIYNPENNFKHPVNLTVKFLDSLKTSLEPYFFQLLKANYAFANPAIFEVLIDNYKRLSDNDKILFRNEFLKTIGQVDLKGFSPEILVNSNLPIYYFFAQAKAIMYITGKNDDPNELFSYLCANYTGMVLDKFLVYYFVKTNIPTSVFNKQLKAALKIVKTDFCLAKLKELDTVSRIPVISNEYDLKDENNRTVNLGEYRGKVVLVDFWFNGCGFCKVFVKEQLVKVEEAFKGNPNVTFVSINVDRDKKIWSNGLKTKEYTLPSSINLNTSGLGSNHPLIKNLNVQGYPSILILNDKGEVVTFGLSTENSPSLYKAEQIILKIKSLL